MKSTILLLCFIFIAVDIFSQIVQNEDVISENKVTEIQVRSENSLKKSQEGEAPYQYEFDSLGRLTSFICYFCERSTAHSLKYNRVDRQFYYNRKGRLDSIKIIRPYQTELDQDISYIKYDINNRVVLVETAYEISKSQLTDSFYQDRELFSKEIYDSIYYFPALKDRISYEYLNESSRKEITAYGFNGNLSKHNNTQIKLTQLNHYNEWQDCNYFKDSLKYYVDNNQLKKVFINKKGIDRLWKEYKYKNDLIEKEIVYDTEKENVILYKLIYTYRKRKG